MDFPERIEAVSLSLAGKNRELQDLREQLGLRESTATLEILGAKDEQGKPLYSNETTRGAAMKLALASNNQYQELSSRIAAVEQERAELMASVERLRGEFRLHVLDKQLEIASLRAGQNS
jgi:hypothetical protein